MDPYFPKIISPRLQTGTRVPAWWVGGSCCICFAVFVSDSVVVVVVVGAFETSDFLSLFQGIVAQLYQPPKIQFQKRKK